VLYFYAPWSEACKQLDSVFEELMKTCNHVNFVKIEAESVPEISIAHEVKAVPAFVFLGPDKKIADRIDGANPPELTKKCNYYNSAGGLVLRTRLEQTTSPSNGFTGDEKLSDNMNSKLKKLVNRSKCMVFMKGSSSAPKCGFSKQLVALLEECNADYQTFDILEDEQVRQGLKEYSNWPTYPQLYIGGELVGGLDIVKEMFESGELQSMLPKKMPSEERLKQLVNKAPVMVFMKGNRSEPRCGFSRTLVDILNSLGVKYETFDIVEDEEVRQGLKTFSNWPTYPQLYVKGELLGGLDIVKEMQAAGELQTALAI